LVNSDLEFIEKSYEILSNSSLEKKLSKEAIKTSITFTKQSFENQLSKIF